MKTHIYVYLWRLGSFPLGERYLSLGLNEEGLLCKREVFNEPVIFGKGVTLEYGPPFPSIGGTFEKPILDARGDRRILKVSELSDEVLNQWWYRTNFVSCIRKGGDLISSLYYFLQYEQKDLEREKENKSSRLLVALKRVENLSKDVERLSEELDFISYDIIQVEENNPGLRT